MTNPRLAHADLLRGIELLGHRGRAAGGGASSRPASSARTASIVSASAAVLSGRYRSTRANRRATPPG